MDVLPQCEGDAERPGRRSHAERGNEGTCNGDAERPGRRSHAERGNEERGTCGFRGIEEDAERGNE